MSEQQRTNGNMNGAPAAIAVAVLLLIATLVGLAVFLWFSIGPAELPKPEGIGETLAQIQLVPLTGESTTIGPADIEGKVAMVNLWATWCPPCRDELPHLADLSEEFADDEFLLLAVCTSGSTDDLQSETTELLDTLDVHIPTYADPNRTTERAVLNATGSQFLPTTVVLDRKGVIRGVWIGYQPDYPEQMREVIASLLQD